MSDQDITPPADGGPSDIRPVSITEEMKKSYLDYAMSVIVARALPDARDGLKPVHRRILYSMHENEPAEREQELRRPVHHARLEDERGEREQDSGGRILHA